MSCSHSKTIGYIKKTSEGFSSFPFDIIQLNRKFLKCKSTIWHRSTLIFFHAFNSSNTRHLYLFLYIVDDEESRSRLYEKWWIKLISWVHIYMKMFILKWSRIYKFCATAKGWRRNEFVEVYFDDFLNDYVFM